MFPLLYYVFEESWHACPKCDHVVQQGLVLFWIVLKIHAELEAVWNELFKYFVNVVERDDVAEVEFKRNDRPRCHTVDVNQITKAESKTQD